MPGYDFENFKFIKSHHQSNSSCFDISRSDTIDQTDSTDMIAELEDPFSSRKENVNLPHEKAHLMNSSDKYVGRSNDSYKTFQRKNISEKNIQIPILSMLGDAQMDATLSLVFGILGIFMIVPLLLSVLAIIYGERALKLINKDPAQSEIAKTARIGIILGQIGVVLILILFGLFIWSTRYLWI